MTTEEINKYILDHYEEQTNEELAINLAKCSSRIRQLCGALGVQPISPSEKIIKVMREANGEKTTFELAAMVNRHVEWVRRLGRIGKVHSTAYWERIFEKSGNGNFSRDSRISDEFPRSGT